MLRHRIFGAHAQPAVGCPYTKKGLKGGPAMLVRQLLEGLAGGPLDSAAHPEADGESRSVAEGAPSANVVSANSLPRYKWTVDALSCFLDVIPEALLAVDGKGLILRANARIEQVFGFARGDLLGRSIGTLLVLDDGKEQWKRLRSQNGEVRELLAMRKDGSRFSIEVGIDKCDVEGDEIFALVIRDVSQRRKWERRYRLLVEEIPAVTFLASLEGDVNELYVSPQIESLLGFTQQQWLEDPLLWFRQLHPEDANRWQDEFALTVASGKPFKSVYRFISKDGHTVWVHGEARVVRDEAGRPLFLQGIAFDITERKKAEELLQRSREELENLVQQRTAELERANQVLAEDIARRQDLELQLAEVNAALERKVHERTVELERQADQLRHLAAQLTEAEQLERRRLARLMHDHLQQLLVAAKLRIDIMRGFPEGAKLSEAVSEASGILSEALEATRTLTAELVPPVLYEHGLSLALEWLAERMRRQQGLTITIDADPKADPRSDQVKALLFESARELLFNVAKYSSTKTGHVKLELTPQAESRLIVMDDGPGFDPALIDARRSAAGGFGLFSIRERLRALGGSFIVDSVVGGRTRIELRMPASAQAAESPQTDVLENFDSIAAPPPAERKRSSRGTIRVLLVDDHKIVREGVANLLREVQAIEVIDQAGDGVEAVQKVRQLRPDVVVMDLNMPRMSGGDALRVIKGEFPETHVICLSMQPQEHVGQTMLEAGATAYLNKDGDPEALINTIVGCMVE